MHRSRFRKSGQDADESVNFPQGQVGDRMGKLFLFVVSFWFYPPLRPKP